VWQHSESTPGGARTAGVKSISAAINKPLMLFGSSGIRQQYSAGLVILAQRVGVAVGSRSAEVLVGMDTRRTGMVIGESLISGVLSAGGSYDQYKKSGGQRQKKRFQ